MFLHGSPHTCPCPAPCMKVLGPEDSTSSLIPLNPTPHPSSASLSGSSDKSSQNPPTSRPSSASIWSGPHPCHLDQCSYPHPGPPSRTLALRAVFSPQRPPEGASEHPSQVLPPLPISHHLGDINDTHPKPPTPIAQRPHDLSRPLLPLCPSLTLLQPHKRPRCSSNTPCTSCLQGLCTSCSHQEHLPYLHVVHCPSPPAGVY